MSSLVAIGPVALEKKMKMWKVYANNDDDNYNDDDDGQRRRTTDKFWSEKLTWAFGSVELKREEGYFDNDSALSV